jgi:ABC-type dipeptide/oligopeptide/nickel transport system permease subunit
MLAAAADISQLQRSPFLLLAPAIVIFIFVFAVRSLAEKNPD